MKILHLIQELGGGGAEQMTVSLVAGAQRVGHEVAVAAAHGPVPAALNVPVFPLPYVRRRIQRLPAAARAVSKALRAWSPDVVHCHNPGMALAFALATIGRRRCRALVSIHGVPESDCARTARLLRWVGLPAVACGPGLASSLQDQGLRLSTIANGVSPPPRPRARGDLEREWEVVRGRKVLVTAGRLVAQKNVAAAIRALAQIPDAALIVMGDGPERASLDREAAAAGVGARLILAGYRHDLREIVAAADAFIIASHSEGLPLVALEALAAGRPLVAAKARWLEGFLTDGEDCLIADTSEAGDLARAVRRVFDDDGLAARLSANAVRRAAAYTEEAAVNEYLRVYETLVSS